MSRCPIIRQSHAFLVTRTPTNPGASATSERQQTMAMQGSAACKAALPGAPIIQLHSMYSMKGAVTEPLSEHKGVINTTDPRAGKLIRKGQLRRFLLLLLLWAQPCRPAKLRLRRTPAPVTPGLSPWLWPAAGWPCSALQKCTGADPRCPPSGHQPGTTLLAY